MGTSVGEQSRGIRKKDQGKRLCHAHWSEALGDFIWLRSRQQPTFTQVLHPLLPPSVVSMEESLIAGVNCAGIPDLTQLVRGIRLTMEQQTPFLPHAP